MRHTGEGDECGLGEQIIKEKLKPRVPSLVCWINSSRPLKTTIYSIYRVLTKCQARAKFFPWIISELS